MKIMSDGLSVNLVSTNPSSIASTMSAYGGALSLNNCAAALANMNSNSHSQQTQQHALMLMNNSPVTCVSQHSSSSLSNSPNSVTSSHHHHQQQSNNTQHLADYLAQLIKDKKQLAIFPNLFLHVERILDEEINRVRGNLFHLSGTKSEPLELPDPIGQVLTLSERVFVPVKDHPDFNFVGRILGPRGMTAKQLEQETGCKIMVRGKGSMRDKKKEEQNRGKPNWEHLNDELHVLITVEDTENRGKIKLERAMEEVKKLLVPAEGEDELKKRQLMELAIINGTYRDSKESRNSGANAQQMVSPQQMSHHLGAPLIISPHRLSNGVGNPPPLLTQTTDSLLYSASPYTSADYATYLSLAEYPPDHVGKMRYRTSLRDHPYLTTKSDPSASLLH